MAFLTYRKGFPMTIRSCFYPLIGDRIYGWMGDLIDSLSVIATMFGVCTSLGIGVITINTALNRIDPNIEESTNNQIICIWTITPIATISVVSGLKIGIKYLSEICFTLGMFLMMFVLFYDNTWYILNLYVQSIGYYIQWIIQIGFHTDAFAQLGNAPDGKQAPTWMDNYTVFYLGWWIAWSPFVGIFIAKISRGRTVRNFINTTLAAPMLYVFLWLSIFGGSGLRMERDAALRGINCSSTLGGTGATEGLDRLYRLSCRNHAHMYFDVLDQYSENLVGFLRIVSLIAIVLYFVTSSDSGSLIIDCLSANGNPEPPVLQRIFWAFTEGACATALLYTGGSKALAAMQTVSIATGLFYTIVLNFMCVALWRVMKEEAGDHDPNSGRHFPTSIFAFFDFVSRVKTINVIVSTVAPWYLAGKTAAEVYGKKPWPYMLALASLFYGWIALEILEIQVYGLAYIGWVVLFGFFAFLIGIRIRIHSRYEISGSMVEDALTVIFLYPLAIEQMYEQVRRNGNYSGNETTQTTVETKF
ncbi:glycine betaine transporter -like [Paramuricea clavata]|uniref:Glycine betaine transporter -like n=1 Tax=Paramuricea clavata TaxID=317549 RepID=A0A6S7I1M8_PARCT|nr:glycine betaine transporter -like [Paramuricea clavata]